MSGCKDAPVAVATDFDTVVIPSVVDLPPNKTMDIKLASIGGEQAKTEAMAVSPTPSTTAQQQRICLVGTVVDDPSTVSAAQTFGVPVISSESGAEIVGDIAWTTYFVMNDFEGPIFKAIQKTKHRILGPPALQHAVESKDGLTYNNRPIYNYSMKGVITCFTGIRKKDELTRLVNLIHSMGGSIRRELNSKITHLICNASGGDKYQYAMTFRLAVIRPSWVHNAWEQRDHSAFQATEIEFTKPHRLKSFEGQKICFLGFSPDEHEHMVEILTANGGVATTIEDVECSHVIISNTANHFPANLPSPTITTDASATITATAITTKTTPDGDATADTENNCPTTTSGDTTTPKSSKTILHQHDGIVLTRTEEDDFSCDTNNISPIMRLSHPQYTLPPTAIVAANCSSNHDGLHNIEEEEVSSDEQQLDTTQNKRKRDSFDNASLLSIDSIAAPSSTLNSAKKLKLIRTGSITRSIRRSMSFVALKNPIATVMRSRRNSSVDPNTSIGSITSIESTFNGSIKKPVKEKMRALRNRILKSNKRDITPKTTTMTTTTASMMRKFKFLNDGNDDPSTPVRSVGGDDDDDDDGSGGGGGGGGAEADFKTPLAPHPIGSSYYQRVSVMASGSIGPKVIQNDVDSGVDEDDDDGGGGGGGGIGGGGRDGIDDIGTTSKSQRGVELAPIDHSTGQVAVSLLPNGTHAVVDTAVPSKPEPKNTNTHIVKSDWFWYTIQNGYADELDYLFENYLESMSNNTSNVDRRESLPISLNSHMHNNKRKRKRLTRTATETTPRISGKRRSSVSDAGLLSVSGSFLDYTASPSATKADGGAKDGIETASGEPLQHVAPKKKSMRYNHFIDLFGTESNYVGILHTIVSLFQKPLEDMADTSDALINQAEVRAIFNNFSPIHDVHLQMLNRFQELQQDWSEDCLIGKIIYDHREALIKAYPPYVNFFEKMKEALQQCDAQNPRFHAFLKINQAKAECGRQTLQDLMIRPVQRLPSVSLLITDILKHTPKSNPDHKELEKALKAIKEVMTYINEDKRKTDGRIALFDIFNGIDNCPPDLVSSHRSFVSKCEVTELTSTLSGRDDPLMLFLFTDYMEVCKIKKSRFNSAKSPTSTTTNHTSVAGRHLATAQKPYKHIKLLALNSIVAVCDIVDGPRAFALFSTKDKVYSFSICDDSCKAVYLKNLCRQLAENACRADAEQFMRTSDSQELNIDVSELNLGTLKKAFNYAKTRLKVTRAFSFNKTPLKLKRPVTSPQFGSTNSLTPATQLAKMKLASCTNINEIGEHDEEEDGDSGGDGVPNGGCGAHLVAPMSVQPTRKAKASTLTMAALRRL